MSHTSDADLMELTFVAAGGTSLAAVELAESIEKIVLGGETRELEVQDLLDTILHHPFTGLEMYVIAKLSRRGMEDLKGSEHYSDGGLGQNPTVDDNTEITSSDDVARDPDSNCGNNGGRVFWASLRRGGCLQNFCVVNTHSAHCDVGKCVSIGMTHHCRISLAWRVDIGKCVDASPLLALGNRWRLWYWYTQFLHWCCMV